MISSTWVNDLRVLNGKTSSESTLLSQSSSRIRPNKVGMQRQKAIVLFLRNRDYSGCRWKWLWRCFLNLKTNLVSRGFTIQLPTKVYCMILTMTISALTKTTSFTITPLFTPTTLLVTTSTASAPTTSVMTQTCTSEFKAWPAC